MSSAEHVEPKWVMVNGELRVVSEFADIAPRQRPAALCPLCECTVHLKLGSKKRHHYAHQREAECAATQSETALHLNTKFHFYQQLLEAKNSGLPLFFERCCQHAHLAGDTCQKRRQDVWIEEWDQVEVEYRIGTFRPDLALLREGQVIGAIEVLVTHAVDERKAKYFEDNRIPWLEMRATPALYEGDAPWQISDPLPGRPEGPGYFPQRWTCDPCRRGAHRKGNLKSVSALQKVAGA